MPNDNAMDLDDRVREDARIALDELWDKYWKIKTGTPAPSFDEYFALRSAYEEAAVEYARLEGRLLAERILSGVQDVHNFAAIRQQMAQARKINEVLDAAARLIGLLVRLV